MRAVYDGRRLGLAVPYGEGIGELMRELGCAWFPPRRMWLCLGEQAARVMTGLKAQAPKLPSYALDDVRELAALAWRAPDADYFACMLDLQLLPLQSGGFAVTSAYDLLIVRA